MAVPNREIALVEPYGGVVKGDNGSPAGHRVVTFLVGRHGGDTINCSSSVERPQPPICHAVAGSVQTPPSAAL